MEIKISLDMVPAEKAILAAKKNQLPFAISKSLNQTVRSSRAMIQRELPGIFTVRRNWIIKGIVTEFSTKHNLTARVGSRDMFMGIHTTGGKRTGRLANVPGPGVRPNFPMVVRRSKWPKALLASQRGRRLPFHVEFKSGRKAIVRRKTKKRLPLEVMWHFPSEVQIDARFDFEDLVEGHVNAVWPNNIVKAIDDAMETAK